MTHPMLAEQVMGLKPLGARRSWRRKEGQTQREKGIPEEGTEAQGGAGWEAQGRGCPGYCSLRRVGNGLGLPGAVHRRLSVPASPPLGLSFMPLQIWSKALAISGVLTMGLALLGCVGALKELRCLLSLVSARLLPIPTATPSAPGQGLSLTSALRPPVLWGAAAPVCHPDHPGDPRLHSEDPGKLARSSPRTPSGSQRVDLQADRD